MSTLTFVFLTLLMSGAGSLTKPDAQPQDIEGTLQSVARVCPQFALADGEFISLSGDIPKVATGTRLALKGEWRQKTKCMRGREFRVLESLKIE